MIPFKDFPADDAAVHCRNQEIVSAITTKRRVQGWPSKLSEGQRKIIEWLLMGIFLTLVLCQLYVIRRAIKDTAAINPAPIAFISLWTSDKAEYLPDETIRFTYTRRTVFDAKEKGPLMATSLSCFENQTTGEVYEGAIAGRVIDEPGIAERTMVTRVPIEATEGEYVFKGWVRAETLQRSEPYAFASNRFKVIHK